MDEICRGGCSIQCIAAMGKIPQIQCKQCLHIFHPECIQITPIGHGLFLCEVSFFCSLLTHSSS